MGSMLREGVRFIFFGNYFYGLCSVALALESSVQQLLPLNDPVFYLLLFSVTVVFYSEAYIVTEKRPVTGNERTDWYAVHHKFLKRSQLFFLVLSVLCAVLILRSSLHNVLSLHFSEWMLLLLFPLAGVLYYGINTRGRNFNLRKIGWMKPFVIGFCWAGIVTVYPTLYHFMSSGGHFHFDLFFLFLFVKNFMFISVLCIMFDIKDYPMDYNLKLKTFVVEAGLRNTIFYIIIPLSIAGIGSYLLFANLMHFPPARIVINLIPFALMLAIAFSLKQPKKILYYLVVIDGLMLVKALCGVSAMLLI
jgi:hypothetical protein